MLLWTLLACAYTVEDWWNDQARAQCTCEQSEPARSCRLELVDRHVQGEYGHCADDAAPVEREAMKAWMRDYTDACILPDDARPEPEDPEWFLACEG